MKFETVYESRKILNVPRDTLYDSKLSNGKVILLLNRIAVIFLN